MLRPGISLVLTALAGCAPVAYVPYAAPPYPYAPRHDAPLPPPVPPGGYGWDGRHGAWPPYGPPPRGFHGERGPVAPPSYGGGSYGGGPYAAPSPAPYGDDRAPGAARPFPEDGVGTPPAGPYRDDGDRYGFRPDPAPSEGQPGTPPYRPAPGEGGNPPVERRDAPPPGLGAPTWR